MNKKPLRKKLFLMKETLIDLTPHMVGQAQGADCTLCTVFTNFQLSQGGSCNPCLFDQETKLRPTIVVADKA